MQPRLAYTLVLAAVIGCGGSGSSVPDAVGITACNDGADNDNDRLTDYPADPGCDSAADSDESNVPIAQCGDGRDNDGDSRADYPDDPGCYDRLDNDEADDCPSGPMCPVCSNGIDDDGDTLIDFPTDDGCAAASDDDEYVTNPNACGPGLIVQRLLSPTADASFLPGTSLITGSCGGGSGTEVAYELVITESTVIIASTDDTLTTADTVMYLLGDCMNPTSELACNDDIDATNHKSSITASVPPGTYYLIVDNKLAGGGDFHLKVDLLAGEGVACTATPECGPGLICRIPSGMTEMVCAQPVCNDGLDDDADGTPDYPGDPGCTAPDDADETDDCPSGPMCPQCGNDMDDDGDGQVDYPEDTGCQAASSDSEYDCPTETDPIASITAPTTSGTTIGATGNFVASCQSNTAAADVTYVLALPIPVSAMTVDTNTSGWDTVLTIDDVGCTSPTLYCDDDSGSPGAESLITTGALAAGTYFITVDGYNGASMPFQLHVHATATPGADCTSPLFASGVLACPPTYACNGSTCAPAACNDGMDNDGDGNADYPLDPGCTDIGDGDETDDCPSGPMCPACSNGLDDDGDSAIDYPADPGCQSAAGPTEIACSAESDPLGTITAPTTNGTTVGAIGDFVTSCQSNTAAGDVSYLLSLPVGLTSLTIDTNNSGWDTVLTIDDPGCVAPTLYCDDDSGSPSTESQITTTALAAGTYIITVDGYNGATNPFQLHVHGIAVSGAACASPLFAAGVISCAAGQTCTAGACM